MTTRNDITRPVADTSMIFASDAGIHGEEAAREWEAKTALALVGPAKDMPAWVDPLIRMMRTEKA